MAGGSDGNSKKLFAHQRVGDREGVGGVVMGFGSVVDVFCGRSARRRSFSRNEMFMRGLLTVGVARISPQSIALVKELFDVQRASERVAKSQIGASSCAILSN